MKKSTIGIVVVLGAGIAVYMFIRSHKATSGSADAEQNTPAVITVQVGALKRITLHRYIEAYGTVEPAPATTDLPAGGSSLAPPSAGIVAKVNVVEGQHVNKGDVLMELNSGVVNFDYAQHELERQQKLYEQHNASLKSLQDAQAQLAALRVVAPLSGFVMHLNARPGQAVDVNTVVAEVADLNRLAVRTDVPTSDVNATMVGDELQLLTQPPVATTVSFISSAVDTNNNTVPVRALLPGGSGLRTGQYVPLRIVTAVHTNCLAAPEKSVVTDIDGNSVISLVNGNETIQKPVQTGFRENGWVEISAPGLKESDKVVTVGAYALPDKTQINIVSATTNEEPAASSSGSNLQ